MIPISALKKQLTSIIMNPKYHDLLAVVKVSNSFFCLGAISISTIVSNARTYPSLLPLSPVS